jgi:hypothetical protein
MHILIPICIIIYAQYMHILMSPMISSFAWCKYQELANEERQRATEKRVQAAKEAQRRALDEQLRMFEDKELMSQKKREEYERMRLEKLEELRLAAEDKSRHLQVRRVLLML